MGRRRLGKGWPELGWPHRNAAADRFSLDFGVFLDALSKRVVTLISAIPFIQRGFFLAAFKQQNQDDEAATRSAWPRVPPLRWRPRLNGLRFRGRHPTAPRDFELVEATLSAAGLVRHLLNHLSRGVVPLAVAVERVAQPPPPNLGGARESKVN